MDEGLPSNPGEIYLDGLWNERNALGGYLIRKPSKSLSREQQARNVEEVFELVGGVPRFAQWANEHYDRFITKVFPKILPNASTSVQNNIGSLNITYQAAIAPSPLDVSTEAVDATYEPQPPADK